MLNFIDMYIIFILCHFKALVNNIVDKTNINLKYGLFTSQV